MQKINGMKIFEDLAKPPRKNEVNDPHLKDFVMNSEIRDNKIIVKPFSNQGFRNWNGCWRRQRRSTGPFDTS